MKNAKKIESKLIVPTLVVAGLCLASFPALSQPADYNPSTPPNQSSTTVGQPVVLPNDQSINTPAGRSDAPGTPTRLNKCSQLIGTPVQNLQGEKLGKIEDIVVTLGDGKVSYCVMSVDHGIFKSAKYLALPLSAMQPSEDGSHMILDADKDKVANAQGFDRNNWPSATNPVWGAQPFWQSTSRPMANPSNQKYQGDKTYQNNQSPTANSSDVNGQKSDLSTPRQDGTNPDLDSQRQHDNNSSTTPSDTTH